MNESTDQQLLRDYRESQAEAAFSELVRRHIDFVYSTSLRMVRDAQLAEDVTQAVFVVLAQNARQLTDHPVLSGWLHRTTQNLAAKTVRSDVRRRAREQEAVAMNELFSAPPDDNWEHIEPHLDAALGALGEQDRDALLLRYFERKSAREIAQVLGVSDEAAQKRVSRAVERLREFFAKRGVAVGTSGLVVALTSNAVHAAPVGLAASISNASVLAGATFTTVSATKVLVMTTLQKTIITATLVAAVGTGIYESRQASDLRSEVKKLEQQQSSLTVQMQESQRENERAMRRLAELQRELSQSKSNQPVNELAKLRSEVSRLRDEANNPTEAAAKAWVTRVRMLKQRLQQTPEANIPELKLLHEEDWLSVVQNQNLGNEKEYRQALSALRAKAEGKVARALLQPALSKFVKANNWQFPTALSQLQSYFENGPIDDSILQRYTILPASTVDNVKVGGEWIITQRTAVDEEHDTRIVIGPNGLWFNLLPWQTGHGRITTPEQQAALQKVLDYEETKNPTH